MRRAAHRHNWQATRYGERIAALAFCPFGLMVRVCRDDYTLTAGDVAAFGMVAAKLKTAVQSTYSPGSAQPSKAATGEVGYEGMNWRPKSQASPFR